MSDKFFVKKLETNGSVLFAGSYDQNFRRCEAQSKPDLSTSVIAPSSLINGYRVIKVESGLGKTTYPTSSQQDSYRAINAKTLQRYKR